MGGPNNNFVTLNLSCVLEHFFLDQPRSVGGSNKCCQKNILSSWVKIRLHPENQLHRLPGSVIKV